MCRNVGGCLNWMTLGLLHCAGTWTNVTKFFQPDFRVDPFDASFRDLKHEIFNENVTGRVTNQLTAVAALLGFSISTMFSLETSEVRAKL